jgi:hypothetical protein
VPTAQFFHKSAKFYWDVKFLQQVSLQMYDFSRSIAYFFLLIFRSAPSISTFYSQSWVYSQANNFNLESKNLISSWCLWRALDILHSTDFDFETAWKPEKKDFERLASVCSCSSLCFLVFPYRCIFISCSMVLCFRSYFSFSILTCRRCFRCTPNSRSFRILVAIRFAKK